MLDQQSPTPTTKPASASPATVPSTSLLPDLPKETWEYLELKLWNSFSKKIWALVTAILSVLGLLTAIGMNAWIQHKVDTALETERERFSAVREDFNRKGKASLLLTAIAFHIRNREGHDLVRYIEKAQHLEETLPPSSLKALVSSEKLSPLIWPVHAFEYGGFVSLSETEVKEALQPLRNSVPEDEFQRLESECQELALASRHMLGLKKMSEAAEKLVLSQIEADPQQLAKLYEDEVLAAYAKEIKSKQGVSFHYSTGEVAINSPNLSGESEFSFYIPNTLDKLFSEESKELEAE